MSTALDTIVKKSPLLVCQFLVGIASITLCFGIAWADGDSTDQPDAENSGLTILNNATNVTHWGLGAGVSLGESPYKGYGTKIAPFPLVTFDDKWVHAQGTTIDAKIGRWNGLSVALRANYSLRDGYKQSDAPILSGMENRNGAFWYGPALAWRTAFGTISAEYLFAGNKGEQAKIDYGKSFDMGDISITPHVGVEWLSGAYVNYYYGVMPSEVRSGRAAYTGTATVNTLLGTNVAYRLTANQHIALNVGVSHLGSGITDSPLVGKRFIPEIGIGYNYQFK